MVRIKQTVLLSAPSVNMSLFLVHVKSMAAADFTVVLDLPSPKSRALGIDQHLCSNRWDACKSSSLIQSVLKSVLILPSPL